MVGEELWSEYSSHALATHLRHYEPNRLGLGVVVVRLTSQRSVGHGQDARRFVANECVNRGRVKAQNFVGHCVDDCSTFHVMVRAGNSGEDLGTNRNEVGRSF